MAIEVTLNVTARTRNVLVFDHLGSDIPLVQNEAYEPDSTIPLVTTNLPGCGCCAPRGALEVRGEVETAPDVWEVREAMIAVEQAGVHQWPA